MHVASALVAYKWREDVCSEPSVMASEPMSLNDLPDEILLEILSYFGPEDLSLIIAKVCRRWESLAKDVALWKTHSYKCVMSSNISRVKEVICPALLVFRTKYLTNFAPSCVLKVRNLKEHFRNWTSLSILSEVRQVSRGLHCVTPSGCYR